MSIVRSTKGASKLRRENINKEINNIRDLLPVTETVKARLSQLQVVSLINVYVNKSNVLGKINAGLPGEDKLHQFFDFTESICGFLLIMDLDGKIIFISENSVEYLAHTPVDIMSQVETIFELLNPDDCHIFTNLLEAQKQKIEFMKKQLSDLYYLHDEDNDVATFTCGLGLLKNTRRNNTFDKYKKLSIKGRFVWTEKGANMKCCLVLTCSSRLNPVMVSEPISIFDTNVFKAVHAVDMKFVHLDENGQYHLEISNKELFSKSWYQFIHPDYVALAALKHKEILDSNNTEFSTSFVAKFVKINKQPVDTIYLHVLLKKEINSQFDNKSCIASWNQILTYSEFEKDDVIENHTDQTNDILHSKIYQNTNSSTEVGSLNIVDRMLHNFDFIKQENCSDIEANSNLFGFNQELDVIRETSDKEIMNTISPSRAEVLSRLKRKMEKSEFLNKSNKFSNSDIKVKKLKKNQFNQEINSVCNEEKINNLEDTSIQENNVAFNKYSNDSNINMLDLIKLENPNSNSFYNPADKKISSLEYQQNQFAFNNQLFEPNIKFEPQNNFTQINNFSICHMDQNSILGQADTLPETNKNVPVNHDNQTNYRNDINYNEIKNANINLLESKSLTSLQDRCITYEELFGEDERNNFHYTMSDKRMNSGGEVLLTMPTPERVQVWSPAAASYVSSISSVGYTKVISPFQDEKEKISEEINEESMFSSLHLKQSKLPDYNELNNQLKTNNTFLAELKDNNSENDFFKAEQIEDIIDINNLDIFDLDILFNNQNQFSFNDDTNYLGDVKADNSMDFNQMSKILYHNTLLTDNNNFLYNEIENQFFSKISGGIYGIEENRIENQVQVEKDYTQLIELLQHNFPNINDFDIAAQKAF